MTISAHFISFLLNRKIRSGLMINSQFSILAHGTNLSPNEPPGAEVLSELGREGSEVEIAAIDMNLRCLH